MNRPGEARFSAFQQPFSSQRKCREVTAWPRVVLWGDFPFQAVLPCRALKLPPAPVRQGRVSALARATCQVSLYCSYPVLHVLCCSNEGIPSALAPGPGNAALLPAGAAGLAAGEFAAGTRWVPACLCIGGTVRPRRGLAPVLTSLNHWPAKAAGLLQELAARGYPQGVWAWGRWGQKSLSSCPSSRLRPGSGHGQGWSQGHHNWARLSARSQSLVKPLEWGSLVRGEGT